MNPNTAIYTATEASHTLDDFQVITNIGSLGYFSRKTNIEDDQLINFVSWLSWFAFRFTPKTLRKNKELGVGPTYQS